MASHTNKHHLRVNSEPALLTGWHAQHRSLSLTARMHANIHLPSSLTQPDVPYRDTGFPEPLSPDRNTTMRHPDADTSPNASIEAHDIDLARTRHRHSFLRERHKIRSGKIAIDTSLTTLNNTNHAKRSDSGYESALAADKDAPEDATEVFLPEGGGFTASPTSSRNSIMVKTIRHSEDLVLEKTRGSTDSIETRKRGFLGRLHSLRHRSQGSRGQGENARVA